MVEWTRELGPRTGQETGWQSKHLIICLASILRNIWTEVRFITSLRACKIVLTYFHLWVFEPSILNQALIEIKRDSKWKKSKQTNHRRQ